jgi:hypothetical protein
MMRSLNLPNLPNPFSRTMDLRLIQLRAEMSSKNPSGG